MDKIATLSILFLFCFQINAQVTIGTNTLPDVGDVLRYTTFDNFQDTVSYKLTGENLNWSYDDFNVTGTDSEGYFDIDTSALRDSFPEANMLVSFGGGETPAYRSDSTIAIVGLQLGDFGGGFGAPGGGFDANIESNLDEPYIITKRPLSYQDYYSDTLEFTVSLSAAVIPGIDSIDFGFPGATIDSIRVLTSTITEEEATAWGTLSILGEQREVLKTEATTTVTTGFEVGLGVFGQILWLDLGDILGGIGGGGGGIPEGLGGDQVTVTYKFLSNDDKRSIVEFTETPILDTAGVVVDLEVGGRLSEEFLTSTENIVSTSDSYTLYPNPSTDFISLQHTITDRLDWACIVNASGQIVRSEKPYLIDSKIKTSDLSSGLYFLMYKSENRINSKAFYKK